MPDSAFLVADEHERLAALRRAELLDTPPEEEFDRLTQLAATLLKVPVAVVSLVDADREFFKSAIGLPTTWGARREVPRASSLAQIALLAAMPLTIEDARTHPLVKDNPIVPEWGVVSYAAVRLRTRDGHAIGSVYVADKVPRVWSDAEIKALTTIAIAAESEIDLRIALKSAERSRCAMQTMLERVPHAVITVSRAWGITFGNDKAAALLQAPPSTLVGAVLWEACPHFAGTELERQLHDAMSATGGTSFDGYLPSTDSWYELDAEPSEEGLTVFFKDVSLRTRVVNELVESERRYRFVFEEGLTCNLVTSPAAQILACNRTFLSAFGFESMQQALATQADSLWRDTAKRVEMLDTLRTDGRFGPCEINLSRVGGEPIVMMVSAVPRFEQGILTEVHSSMLDLTELKKLEAQFRQSQKMEAVGQLAGGMAHDFNNLLTVIKAYVQLALGELDEDAPLRADMKVIGDAADRAAELTRQLLAFSRLQVLMPQRLNLRTVVTEMAPMIHALLGPEVELRCEVERNVPDIQADRSQLEQVLMNLAVNARDAMPSGGTIVITLDEAVVTTPSTAHDSAPPGSYVTLAVRDSGTGMSPETAAQIFEPFFTTKGPGKGTGLGLSTVYGIVKQSGGTINIASVINGGTTFTIYLPVAAATPAKRARVSGADSAGLRAVAARTVLVVHDDVSMLRALSRTVARAGYTVLEATNAEHALEVANAQTVSIDLLLTDAEMNGVRGLANGLRATTPTLPILLIIGTAAATTLYEPLEGGEPYWYVAKPFRMEELTGAVHAAIGSLTI